MKDVKNKDIVALYKNGLTMKEIGEIFDISLWTVLDRLKKVGVRKTIRHSVDEKIFEKFCAENCYWAGFIAADGWVDNKRRKVSIQLSSVDERHLIKICKFAKRDVTIWKQQRNRNGKIFNYSQVALNSSKIVSDLSDNFNIVPAKSLILKPPEKMPDYLRKHFIRGFIDGDGCIGWHKGNNTFRLYIVSGSVPILEWLLKIIREENRLTYFPKVTHKKDKAYYVEFNGHYVKSILDWLYADSAKETRLDRKYERYVNYR